MATKLLVMAFLCLQQALREAEAASVCPFEGLSQDQKYEYIFQMSVQILPENETNGKTQAALS
jgi:hypothetical protein